MLPLLAALPTIFSAIGKVTQLFETGKNTVQKITGSVSQASTPEELQAEVSNLTPDQQNRWAEIMTSKVELYAKQNERLAVEIGLIDQNITSKLTPEAAGEIAYLRMTTRPWAVRWMVHYILFPFYLVGVDLIQNVVVTWLPFLHTKFGIDPYNSFEHVFGAMQIPDNASVDVIQKIATLFSNGGSTTFAGELYTSSVPWVVSIILGYMGLREIGKAREPSDNGAAANSPVSLVTKALSQGMDITGNIKGWFHKHK
jgi:hypothetical protein